MIKPVIRQVFDPSNKDHRDIAIYFLKNKSWENGCPFELSWPYTDIPSMVKDKLLEYYIQ